MRDHRGLRHRRAGHRCLIALGSWLVEARDSAQRQAAYGRLRRKLARVILLGPRDPAARRHHPDDRRRAHARQRGHPGGHRRDPDRAELLARGRDRRRGPGTGGAPTRDREPANGVTGPGTDGPISPRRSKALGDLDRVERRTLSQVSFDTNSTRPFSVDWSRRMRPHVEGSGTGGLQRVRDVGQLDARGGGEDLPRTFG